MAPFSRALLQENTRVLYENPLIHISETKLLRHSFLLQLHSQQQALDLKLTEKATRLHRQQRKDAGTLS
uniref:Uncharacterized protein n=1 Tax=Utricularia reniformis TaxID=192314 RepID=A0A1Y0B0T1_9LAMI|nr:hypothetical protein AEK19_MT0767 [Utricularia reniformis]ART31010.1 hypothetical protein AEK19_MT0767 [Utricularia reniformis]